MSIVTVQNTDADSNIVKIVNTYKAVNKLLNSFLNSEDTTYVPQLESNLIANVLLHSLNVLKNDFDMADTDLYSFVNKVHEGLNSYAINCYLEQPEVLISNLKSAVDLEDVKFNIENGCDY